MKTIGLLGGMSWESSAEYYRIINQQIKQELGGHHSAKILLYSVDFDEIAQLQHQNKWGELTQQMIHYSKLLEQGGADMLVICTNTMHLMVPDIEKHIHIPILHIADAAGLAIQQQKLKKTALLGTKFTMQQDFYKQRLMQNYDISVIVPNAQDQETVHRIIYNELIHGQIRSESKRTFLKIIQQLHDEEAEGIILGCTEIPLLIQQTDCLTPLFDTTLLHASMAAKQALKLEV